MTKCFLKWRPFKFVALVFLASPLLCQAQYFNTPGNGDLLAGFRKTGGHQGTNEIVAYVDNVTNLIALNIGQTVTLGNISAPRLTDAFGSDYTYIQWSVFGANHNTSSPWNTPLGAFPKSTVWYTVPRTNVSVQSASPSRYSYNQQASLANVMSSVGTGANTIGSQLAGGTNADNNTILVREPFLSIYSQFYLTTFMGDTYNYGSTFGDLEGNVLNFSVENITPSPFNSPVRSDLYEAAPAPQKTPPQTFPDPISGSTNSVYFVGYFELSPAGVLTFTRAVAAVIPTLPPVPTLGVTRSGITNVISLSTTNGAIYSLIFTNAAGLSSPRSNWPTLGSSITGTGGVIQFTDTSADSNRVYSVRAH